MKKNVVAENLIGLLVQILYGLHGRGLIYNRKLILIYTFIFILKYVGDVNSEW